MWGKVGTARVIPAKNAGNTSTVPALQSLRLRGSRFHLLFWVEVHLSALSIQKFCNQAVTSVQLSAEDWQVEYT